MSRRFFSSFYRIEDDIFSRLGMLAFVGAPVVGISAASWSAYSGDDAGDIMYSFLFGTLGGALYLGTSPISVPATIIVYTASKLGERRRNRD